VREYLNNGHISDIDIEIYDISANKLHSLMNSINANSYGKSFFVYKYKDIDIALARSEKQVSNHHNGFEVKIESSERKACVRRDFKMNSIMMNLFTYEILDIFNGINDIKNKTVSIINETRFKEDSLRVLRAVQFCARLGFRCDKYSINIMQNISIDNISNSRIFAELEKLFLASYLHIGWFYFVKLGIFKYIFKKNCPYGRFANTYKKLKTLNIKSNKELYRFYFLYVIFEEFHFNKRKFFNKNNIFPNIYKKILIKQKYTPKNTTDKFLIALSLRYPLKDWLGCENKEIKKRAMKLDIYEKSFQPTISIDEIIKMGYKKEEIKIKFKELAYKEIKQIRQLANNDTD